MTPLLLAIFWVGIVIVGGGLTILAVSYFDRKAEEKEKTEEDTTAVIYLASRYERREELLGYKARLEAAGYEVNARWLTGTQELPAVDTQGMGLETEESFRLRGEWARIDLEDIDRSDALVLFTEPPGKAMRGGCHVEFGYALNFLDELELVVVGPRGNIFQYLDDVRHFETFDHLLAQWEKENA